jgi:hypothetical protein
MECIAEKDIKNCCCQEKCCNDCNFEDCHESCKEWEKTEDCECCIWSIKTVHEEINSYDTNKLAIYLHSFQGQNYSIEDIKNILTSNIDDFK